MTCAICKFSPIDCYDCHALKQASIAFDRACDRCKTARSIFDQKLWATGVDHTESAWQQMEVSMRELDRAERESHETSQALLALKRSLVKR